MKVFVWRDWAGNGVGMWFSEWAAQGANELKNKRVWQGNVSTLLIQQPAVVVYLSEVIRQVHGQVNEEKPGRCFFLEY